MSQAPYSNSADWLRPAEEQEGLKRYVETIRERFRLIVATVLLTTLIAIFYVLAASKTYEATADMLITPVSSSDPVLISLGLLRESADPTRDVQTASQLITNIDVARRAVKNLGTNESPEALLEAVSAEPVASSNIIAITATEASPQAAQAVANTFAAAAVEERTAALHRQIDERLPRLEAISGADGETTEAGGTSIAAQIAELQALRAGPDPTMRVQTNATLPTSQASPKPTLSIIAGVLAGLILGLGGAFALQVLDPTLRRESQLRRLYRLPVLARIPRAPRMTARRPLAPGKVSPLIDEAYRTLRATLTSTRHSVPGGRVVLVTGSSHSEGKTTTAINLASSLALLGKRVMLIEADLRRPSLGAFFDIAPENGVVSVLSGRTQLAEALERKQTSGAASLQLLLAESDLRGGLIPEMFATERASEMIAEAREMADFVIIDSPPLSEVVDGLPLAAVADDVLLVVRLGHSRLDKMEALGELLAENDISPAGFVLVGVRSSRSQNPYASRYPGHRSRGKADVPSPPKSASSGRRSTSQRA